ncbi:hypothetical protein RCL1_007483 [Eukaryota sp. TZLM3-RCL]
MQPADIELSRQKPTTITLTAGITNFFVRRNIKWLSRHLNDSSYILRCCSLLVRQFVQRNPNLAYALLTQDFWIAVTDIFTKHSWHTLINNSIKKRVIEAPSRPNFTNDVYTALRATYLAEIHFTGFFRYNPLVCNVQILLDRCRKLSINYKVMLKTMYISVGKIFLIAFAKELDCPAPKLYAELFDQEEPELLTSPQFAE